MNNGIQLRDRRLELQGRPLLMGILNVTPDSFSDGGNSLDAAAAVQNGLKMIADGADIVDVGGESTRPGSAAVPEDLEIDRVVPVVIALKKELPQIVLSVDTRKSRVAAAALEAGADIVNDVSGLTYDPALADVTAKYRAALVLMHMRGNPATMQSPECLIYHDVVREVAEFLRQATEQAIAAGVERAKIIWDPGIGFAKDLNLNLELLGRIAELHADGYPLLVGPSRKAFIGKLLNRAEPQQRDWGTAGAACHLAAAGVQIIRVHEVSAIRDALTVFTACRSGEK